MSDRQTPTESGAPYGGDRPALLLVHGAFHGAWAWQRVQDRLTSMGWMVRTVDLPSVAAKGGPRFGMYDDAAVVVQHLEANDGPVVVVAHSYGGVPVAQAAVGLSHVRHLVYVAAFQLDVGESVLGAIGNPPPWWNVDGDTMSVDNPAEVMYGDVPPAVATWAESRLRPTSYAVVEESLTAAAWHDIPSTYVVCEHDQAIPPSVQEQMGQRATDIRRLPSAHSPMLSVPDELAQLLTEVAGSPSSDTGIQRP